MPTRRRKNESRRNKLFYELMGFASVGLEMGIAVGICAYIGYRLDEWLVWSKPWGGLIFLALGIAAAFNSLLRTVKEIQKKQKEYEKDERDK